MRPPSLVHRARHLPHALLVTVCLMAVGCVTSRMQRLDTDVRPARAPESIVALEQAPAAPYTVIACVEARSNSAFKGFDELRRAVVDEAAQLGGDAVILGRESRHTDFLILTTGLIPMDRKTLSAQVIVFSEARPAVPR